MTEPTNNLFICPDCLADSLRLGIAPHDNYQLSDFYFDENWQQPKCLFCEFVACFKTDTDENGMVWTADNYLSRTVASLYKMSDTYQAFFINLYEFGLCSLDDHDWIRTYTETPELADASHPMATLSQLTLREYLATCPAAGNMQKAYLEYLQRQYGNQGANQCVDWASNWFADDSYYWTTQPEHT